MAENPIPEEELARYKERLAPALTKYKVCLEWITTRIFEQFPADAASLANIATAEFVRNAGLDRRYMALFEEAADIAAKKLPPERLLYFRRGVAAVRDPNKLRGKQPPLDDFKGDGVSKRDAARIVAVVAID